MPTTCTTPIALKRHARQPESRKSSLESLRSSMWAWLRWRGGLAGAPPAPPSSAWNPLGGGFGDAFGRLVWSALADPAFLPSPHGRGWIENRVSAIVEKSEKPIAVPEDALFSAGHGKTATARIVYRVRNSAFHDGTPMSFADLVYAYTFTNPERLRGVRLL